MFTDKTGKNSTNSTFIITQENIYETRNFTQPDNQTISHFMNEEVVGTMPKTEEKRSSFIHPTLKTPNFKTIDSNHTTIQLTVKFSVAPKYSQMDYQTFRQQQNNDRQINKKHLKEIIFQTIIKVFLRKMK